MRNQELVERLQEIKSLVENSPVLIDTDKMHRIKQLSNIPEEIDTEEIYCRDDISHALAYGYSARREGLSHHQALLNYKQANNLE